MRPTRDEQAFAELLEGLRREAPADVARFARLAQALGSVRPGPGPQPDFRNALRNRLIAEAALKQSWFDRVAERWVERNMRLRRNLRVVFAAGVAALVLLAGGSIFAVADKAVPGDWNYWAKRARENAHLLITRADVPRAYYEMDLARERLEEVRELVNRNEDREGPFRQALDDMDAKTLDATSLLVGYYRKHNRSLVLDRLAQFAVAQKNGLEALVDRMPPGARSPARDSIDILNLVGSRVTGILGGCLCPANPLLPKVSGGTTTPASEENGTPQAPRCACDQFRNGNGGGQAAGPSNPRRNDQPPTTQTPPEEPPGLLDPVTEPVDDVTSQVNDLIDDALTGTPLEGVVEDPLPALTPLLP
jgi:hypothetical protein